MTKKLLTSNISLDTSFIEAQNFLAGSKMNDLSNLCKKGHIKLYLSDITYRELIARFYKNLVETGEKVKKPKEQLENNARLLRNFPDLKAYFELPAIDIETLCTKFKIDFDKWITENKVEVISTDHLNIKDVFNDYFNNKPPFKEGQKKHEFPDAFTLKALSDYFTKEKDRTYLLSYDKDILNFISKTIIPVEDSAVLFDLIIRTKAEILVEAAIKMIEQEFSNAKFNLEKETREIINRAIEDEVGSKGYAGDLEIDCLNDIDLSDIEFGEFSIVNINMDTETAKLECDINFSFEFSFTANDYSEAWHDNEDDKWYFIESKTFSTEDTYDIPITITASFDLKRGFVELEVEDINNGKKLDVFDSFQRRRY